MMLVLLTFLASCLTSRVGAVAGLDNLSPPAVWTGLDFTVTVPQATVPSPTGDIFAFLMELSGQHPAGDQFSIIAGLSTRSDGSFTVLYGDLTDNNTPALNTSLTPGSTVSCQMSTSATAPATIQCQLSDGQSGAPFTDTQVTNSTGSFGLASNISPDLLSQWIFNVVFTNVIATASQVITLQDCQIEGVNNPGGNQNGGLLKTGSVTLSSDSKSCQYSELVFEPPAASASSSVSTVPSTSTTATATWTSVASTSSSSQQPTTTLSSQSKTCCPSSCCLARKR